MGPNTVTGHLSVIYTVECQINFTMRMIRPVMESLRQSRASFVLLIGSTPPDSVSVTTDAERRDVEWIQRKMKEMVWNTGCTSWFIDAKTGRNTQMYPDWQLMFWLRSIWIPRRDFDYRISKDALERQDELSRSLSQRFARGMAIILTGIVLAQSLGG